jgi:hypothetical protein
MRKRRCRKRFTLGHLLCDRDRAALSSPVDVPTIGDSEHENRTVRSVDLENDAVRADAQSPRLLAADTPTVDVRQLAQFAIGSRRKVDAPGDVSSRERGAVLIVERLVVDGARGERFLEVDGFGAFGWGVPPALRFDAPDENAEAPASLITVYRTRRPVQPLPSQLAYRLHRGSPARSGRNVKNAQSLTGRAFASRSSRAAAVGFPHRA